MTITMHALVERHKALAAKLRDRDATIQYYRARLKARDAKMNRVLTLVREVGCVLVTLEVGACRSKSCSSSLFFLFLCFFSIYRTSTLFGFL